MYIRSNYCTLYAFFDFVGFTCMKILKTIIFSGKTSIATVLFRLVEITSGRVFIDGVDIADLPLVKLRSSLSTITQVPVMFLGTVR